MKSESRAFFIFVMYVKLLNQNTMILILKEQNYTHIIDFTDPEDADAMPSVDYVVESFLHLISDLFYDIEEVKVAANNWKP